MLYSLTCTPFLKIYAVSFSVAADLSGAGDLLKRARARAEARQREQAEREVAELAQALRAGPEGRGASEEQVAAPCAMAARRLSVRLACVFGSSCVVLGRFR